MGTNEEWISKSEAAFEGHLRRQQQHSNYLGVACRGLNDAVAPRGPALKPHPWSNRIAGHGVKIVRAGNVWDNNTFPDKQSTTWNMGLLRDPYGQYRGIVKALWVENLTVYPERVGGFGLSANTKLGTLDVLYLEMIGFEVYKAKDPFEPNRPTWHAHSENKDGCVCLRFLVPRAVGENTLHAQGPYLSPIRSEALTWQIDFDS